MSGGKLYFPLAEVAELVKATEAATAHRPMPDYMDGMIPEGPALMWVKDDGTYLMSNATRAEGELPDIIRARAMEPTGPVLDGDQWDLTRAICGGDDFAEYLPLAEDNFGEAMKAAAADGLKWLCIEVHPTRGGDEVGTIGISVHP